MHDVFLAKEIIDTVIKLAKKNRLRKVRRIKIGLGRIEDHHEIIKPANLKFNFQFLAEKSAVLREAKLVIKKIQQAGWSLEEIEE